MCFRLAGGVLTESDTERPPRRHRC
jgi:hypothetical protein